MNDERLKNPKDFGGDYFDELLERIRDIRSSEKRVYLKVRDIFATSIDYDPKSDHGHTAAELLNAFLKFTGREVLDNAGSISKEIVDTLARKQNDLFEEYRRKND